MINPEFISKIINNLDTSKSTEQGDIPTKIIKDNKFFFSYFISASFNNSVTNGVFPQCCMHDQLLIWYFEKITMIRYCQNITVDLEKGLAHNIAY